MKHETHDLSVMLRRSRHQFVPGMPLSVERIDPGDGDHGVFRDVVILIRLSSPVDPQSVTDDNFRVETAAGPVPGDIDLSPDGKVVFWRGRCLLAAGSLHCIVAEGLRDRRGRTLDRFDSRFVTSDLTLPEIAS